MGALTDEISFVAVDDIFFKTTECNNSNGNLINFTLNFNSHAPEDILNIP